MFFSEKVKSVRSPDKDNSFWLSVACIAKAVDKFEVVTSEKQEGLPLEGFYDVDDFSFADLEQPLEREARLSSTLHNWGLFKSQSRSLVSFPISPISPADTDRVFLRGTSEILVRDFNNRQEVDLVKASRILPNIEYESVLPKETYNSTQYQEILLATEGFKFYGVDTDNKHVYHRVWITEKMRSAVLESYNLFTKTAEIRTLTESFQGNMKDTGFLRKLGNIKETNGCLLDRIPPAYVFHSLFGSLERNKVVQALDLCRLYQEEYFNDAMALDVKSEDLFWTWTDKDHEAKVLKDLKGEDTILVDQLVYLVANDYAWRGESIQNRSVFQTDSVSWLDKFGEEAIRRLFSAYPSVANFFGVTSIQQDLFVNDDDEYNDEEKDNDDYKENDNDNDDDNDDDDEDDEEITKSKSVQEGFECITKKLMKKLSETYGDGWTEDLAKEKAAQLKEHVKMMIAKQRISHYWPILFNLLKQILKSPLPFTIYKSIKNFDVYKKLINKIKDPKTTKKERENLSTLLEDHIRDLGVSLDGVIGAWSYLMDSILGDKLDQMKLVTTVEFDSILRLKLYRPLEILRKCGALTFFVTPLSWFPGNTLDFSPTIILPWDNLNYPENRQKVAEGLEKAKESVASHKLGQSKLTKSQAENKESQFVAISEHPVVYKEDPATVRNAFKSYLNLIVPEDSETLGKILNVEENVAEFARDPILLALTHMCNEKNGRPILAELFQLVQAIPYQHLQIDAKERLMDFARGIAEAKRGASEIAKLTAKDKKKVTFIVAQMNASTRAIEFHLFNGELQLLPLKISPIIEQELLSSLLDPKKKVSCVEKIKTILEENKNNKLFTSRENDINLAMFVLENQLLVHYLVLPEKVKGVDSFLPQILLRGILESRKPGKTPSKMDLLSRVIVAMELEPIDALNCFFFLYEPHLNKSLEWEKICDLNSSFGVKFEGCEYLRDVEFTMLTSLIRKTLMMYEPPVSDQDIISAWASHNIFRFPSMIMRLASVDGFDRTAAHEVLERMRTSPPTPSDIETWRKRGKLAFLSYLVGTMKEWEDLQNFIYISSCDRFLHKTRLPQSQIMQIQENLVLFFERHNDNELKISSLLSPQEKRRILQHKLLILKAKGLCMSDCLKDVTWKRNLHVLIYLIQHGSITPFSRAVVDTELGFGVLAHPMTCINVSSTKFLVHHVIDKSLMRMICSHAGFKDIVENFSQKLDNIMHMGNHKLKETLLKCASLMNFYFSRFVYRQNNLAFKPVSDKDISTFIYSDGVLHKSEMWQSTYSKPQLGNILKLRLTEHSVGCGYMQSSSSVWTFVLIRSKGSDEFKKDYQSKQFKLKNERMITAKDAFKRDEDKLANFYMKRKEVGPNVNVVLAGVSNSVSSGNPYHLEKSFPFHFEYL